MSIYPAVAAARDRFVLERRSSRPPYDPRHYHNLIVEDEPSADGTIARSATVFLTGRECPWRCVMCDLWQYTTADDTPLGAIPAQVAAARRTLGDRREKVSEIKLYNAGNFFDPRAVPPADYDAIAANLAGLTRVVVESHPALIGRRVDRFLDALNRGAGDCTESPRLEVAMGLETVHPAALEALNKRMTVDDFDRAADRLRRSSVDLRVFLLIAPPFVPSDQQDAWILRSIDVALSCGATVVSLIPTRTGNGAIDALAREGAFRPPDLRVVERIGDLARTHVDGRGRLFVDLWDLERLAACSSCFAERRDRLHRMNLEQTILPRVACAECGSSSGSAS
jgi:radical SAM enzyme (TIGR01210 family)